MKHKVAVYGTLRPRDGKGQYEEATHYLSGYRMYNYHDKFPYVEKSTDESDIVLVNILEVDDKGLDHLDRYEGVDNGLYTREQEEVWSRDDDTPETELAWVYVAGNISPERIVSGDWNDR